MTRRSFIVPETLSAAASQESDAEAGRAVHDEIRHDLTDDGRELETVAGEAAGDDNVRIARMQPQDEIPVGREIVLANCGFDHTAARARHPCLQSLLNRFDVIDAYGSIETIHRGNRTAGVKRRLYAVTEIRKTVEHFG